MIYVAQAYTKTDYAGEIRKLCRVPRNSDLGKNKRFFFFLIEFHLLPNHVNISFRLTPTRSVCDPLVCPFADTFMFALYLWIAYEREKRQQKTGKTKRTNEKKKYFRN